jgi:hypothetical protein
MSPLPGRARTRKNEPLLGRARKSAMAPECGLGVPKGALAGASAKISPGLGARTGIAKINPIARASVKITPQGAPKQGPTRFYHLLRRSTEVHLVFS